MLTLLSSNLRLLNIYPEKQPAGLRATSIPHEAASEVQLERHLGLGEYAVVAERASAPSVAIRSLAAHNCKAM